MNNLVVYYSFKGHTEAAAKELQALIGGELKAIEETKPRKESSFMGAAFSALMGRKSRLKPMDWSFSGCDNLFIGFPVWAGHSVPAINGFVKKANFSGKKVYLLCTAADPDPAKAQVIIDGVAAKIKAKGGEIAGSCFVCSPLKEPLDTEAARQTLGEWASSLDVR